MKSVVAFILAFSIAVNIYLVQEVQHDQLECLEEINKQSDQAYMAGELAERQLWVNQHLPKIRTELENRCRIEAKEDYLIELQHARSIWEEEKRALISNHQKDENIWSRQNALLGTKLDSINRLSKYWKACAQGTSVIQAIQMEPNLPMDTTDVSDQKVQSRSGDTSSFFLVGLFTLICLLVGLVLKGKKKENLYV